MRGSGGRRERGSRDECEKRSEEAKCKAQPIMGNEACFSLMN
jgi:hypothetical protein